MTLRTMSPLGLIPTLMKNVHPTNPPRFSALMAHSPPLSPLPFALGWQHCLPPESDSPVSGAWREHPLCLSHWPPPAPVAAVCWVPQETHPRGRPRCPPSPWPPPPSHSRQMTSPTSQNTEGQVGSPKPLHFLPRSAPLGRPSPRFLLQPQDLTPPSSLDS